MAVKPRLVVNVRERDLGLGHILREAAKLRKKPFVAVGVTQKKGSKLRPDGKMTNADVAQIHEYGAPNADIPERSFIRSTVNHNQPKYDSHIAELRDQIFDANAGMTVEKALGLIGQEVSADMKNTIRTNQAGLDGPTPLKNRDGTPLDDTGQLLGSISYETVMEGQGDAAYAGEGPRTS